MISRRAKIWCGVIMAVCGGIGWFAESSAFAVQCFYKQLPYRNENCSSAEWSSVGFAGALSGSLFGAVSCGLWALARTPNKKSRG